MPGRYGFFSTVEITLESPGGKQHIVLGQEFDPRMEMTLGIMYMGMLIRKDGSALTEEDKDSISKLGMYPVVTAGSFDFQEPVSRKQLQQLADDPATKLDIRTVIADVLELSAEGKLRTVEQWKEWLEKDMAEEEVERAEASD